MSDPQLPPEKWRPYFDKIDVEFGYRPLATHIGMDHTRLRRLLLGGGTTNDAIEAVAAAFKVSPDVIRELRGEPTGYEPFTLPDDAGRLTHNERDVIRAMVRALLEARGTTDGVEDSQEPSASAAQGQGQKTSDGVKAPWLPPGRLGAIPMKREGTRKRRPK